MCDGVAPVTPKRSEVLALLSAAATRPQAVSIPRRPVRHHAANASGRTLLVVWWTRTDGASRPPASRWRTYGRIGPACNAGHDRRTVMC